MDDILLGFPNLEICHIIPIFGAKGTKEQELARPMHSDDTFVDAPLSLCPKADLQKTLMLFDDVEWFLKIYAEKLWCDGSLLHRRHMSASGGTRKGLMKTIRCNIHLAMRARCDVRHNNVPEIRISMIVPRHVAEEVHRRSLYPGLMHSERY